MIATAAYLRCVRESDPDLLECGVVLTPRPLIVVDVSTATDAELLRVPLIGRKTLRAINTWRPTLRHVFPELTAIPGLTQARIEEIRRRGYEFVG